jgi:ABC exporter DevB family membrane fusion protein
LLLLPLSACGDRSVEAPAGAQADIAAAGLVEPAGEERVLIPEIGGRLKLVAFAEGDTVVAGQLMAEIENADYRATVDAAAAEVAQREAELSRLRAGARREERDEAHATLAEATATAVMVASELKRRRALHDRSQIGREALEQSQSNHEAAQARLAAAAARHRLIESGPRDEDVAIAEAALSAAKAQHARALALLEKTLIRSPIDGVVLKRDLREGETVVALSPIPLARIGDLSTRYVRAEIDELDIDRIKPGQRAEIRSDSYRGQVFGGEVTRVSQRMGRRNAVSDSPTEKVDSRILEALIRLDPNSTLPIGLRVDVRIDSAP